MYGDARAEKDARAAEYSAVKRVLGREAVVIADGLNYIKGLRYQFYCEAKTMETASCVVCLLVFCNRCGDVGGLDWTESLCEASGLTLLIRCM